MLESLVIRGAENHQTTLEGAQGGDIELSRKILILNTSEVATVRLSSTSGLDTSQSYRIEGVSDFNLKLVEEVQLGGVIAVSSISEFAYIERITKTGGSALVGTVSIIMGETVIGTLEPELGTDLPETTDILNLLREVPSNPTLEKSIHEKFFLYNPTTSQVTFTIKEFSDPDSCVVFAFEQSVNGNDTSLNRELRPISVPLNQFNSIPKTQTLEPGEYVGVWIRVYLEGGGLVTSKRYSLKIEETASALVGSGPSMTTTVSSIVARLLSRHAGGLGLVEPLSIRNSHPLNGGGNPLQWVELRDGKMVAEMAFEPDPSTFRDRFYYNTRLNQLFRKIQSRPHPVWKSAR